MSALSECSGCLRHVKVTESTCPFCGTALTATTTATPIRSAVRLGRAALVALGAGGVALACEEPKSVYGGPPVEMIDAGPAPSAKPVPTPTTEPTPAPTPTPTTVPPPTPTTKNTTSPPVPAYGGPPPSLNNPAPKK